MVQKDYGLFTREGKKTAQSILFEYVRNPVPRERFKYFMSDLQYIISTVVFRLKTDNKRRSAIRNTLRLLYKKGLVHGALSQRCIFMGDGPDASEPESYVFYRTQKPMTVLHQYFTQKSF